MRAWHYTLLFVLCLGWGCGDDDATDAALPDANMDVPSTCAEVCDDGVFCNGVETCFGGECTAGSPPCEEARCMEADRRCAMSCADADADGDGVDAIECGGTDCDDSDANRYPGNSEVCDADGHDEDCDGETLGVDLDGDGFVSTRCCNGDRCGNDCDDHRRWVAPGESETCDLIDSDCDGRVDEGVLVSGFTDEDHDFYGDPDSPTRGCLSHDNISRVPEDCDDMDPSSPGSELLSDAADNDCDGQIDEADGMTRTQWPDADGDGYGNPAGTPLDSSVPVEGYAPISGDCDDADPEVFPGAPERCNARDDDCDGFADFRLGPGDLEDNDGDGVADAACEGGSDCNDLEPDVYPGAEELCDGLDNDCNPSTAIDSECVEVTWFLDEDGDGFGTEASTMSSSRPLAGYARRGLDCDDNNPRRFPGAVEQCNGIDDDCDSIVDDKAELACEGTHGLYVCTAGECALLACGREFADCNGGSDGCETRISSVGNCGACGTTCAPGPNTVPMCLELACAYACVGGFADCNGDVGLGAAGDGCEVDLMTDADNCSVCGLGCRQGEDTTGICRAGACEYTCTLGHADCDGDLDAALSNYCETDTTNDASNCGICDRACSPVSPLCAEGACSTWEYGSTGADGPFVFTGNDGHHDHAQSRVSFRRRCRPGRGRYHLGFGRGRA